MLVRKKPTAAGIKQKKKRPYIPKPEPDPLPAKYLTIVQVAKRFHVSKRAIEWWVQKDRFPKPHRFGHRTSLWLISEVEEHERNTASKAQRVRAAS
jgi:predicted DNA-binding transcriptional regulator AlpA